MSHANESWPMEAADPSNIDGGPAVALASPPQHATDIAALGSTKTARVDQAYQEYCERVEGGETIDPDAYCDQFPSMRSSLHRLLGAHRFLEEHLALTDPDAEIHWPRVGETFLDYRLVLELGQGAFARVFLATESKLGNRLVAVKIAPQGGAAEAEILGRIQHANIVPVYSVQTDRASKLTLVCMPYVGSATLHDVLDLGKAPTGVPAQASAILNAARDLAHPVDPSAHSGTPSRTLVHGNYLDGVRSIGAQLAEALSYIHVRGICHLDLKPSNVLLSPAGVPMLLDFNLSSDSLKKHQLQGGTVPYMSPEQLQVTVRNGLVGANQAPSDLFSLGVILYQLTTGVHPFGPLPLKAPTAELAAQLLQQQEKGLVPVRKRNPQVDAALASVIETCLALDPAQRPSAAAVAVAMRKQLRPVARSRRWIGRNPMKVLAGLFLFLALGVAAVAVAATRPPVSERHYAAGIEAYRRGEFTEATHRFHSAIQTDPALAKAYFARGRAYQKLAATDETNYVLAISDFTDAQKLEPNGRNLAAIAYCLNCRNQAGVALLNYERALNSGYLNAEVFNNLGFCRFIGGKSAQECRKDFDKAIEMNPALAVAYHNRAMVHRAKARDAIAKRNLVRTAAEQKKFLEELKDALEFGAADFNLALNLSQPNGELFVDAACFYALDSEGKKLALSYLTKAVHGYGFSPRLLKSNPMLTSLKNDKEFQALLLWPEPIQPMQRAVRFVDPLMDTEP